MPAPTFADSPTVFVGPYETDWTDHPQLGRLAAGSSVNVSVQRYLYDVSGQTLAITIDIADANMWISRCGRGDFDGNFWAGDGVLEGESRAGQMPVHLSFTPPLRCVGANVSATGNAGLHYQGLMDVRCADGSGAKFKVDGVLGRARGTAPFAGAVAPAGTGITDIWFDAVHSDNQVQFASVAINNLLWEL